MAVAVMGPDDDNPVFHDFLGMSCGDPLASPAPPLDAQAAASASASASLGASSGARGIMVCGTPDLGSGRKRGSSELSNLDVMRDKKLPTGSDCLERSNLTKMFGKEVEAEQAGRSLTDEIMFSLQPPQRPTSLIIRPPPVSHRPNSPVLRWERSVPHMSSQQTAHYPAQLLPTKIYAGIGSSHKDKDAGVGAIVVSQSAADEGSRTGNKGYGVLKIIDPGGGVGERHITGSLPSRSGLVAAHMRESASNLSSHHGVSSIGRQMTIFYAGQAHVFDNVHPNKADVIMALAGSSGGSWSTMYCPNSDSCRSAGELKIPGSEDDKQTSNIRASGPLSQISGVFLGCLATGDPRPAKPAAEPQLDGKRDA